MSVFPAALSTLCLVGQFCLPGLAIAADNSLDLPDCTPFAEKVLDHTDGKVLSIKTSKASCKIVVLIPREGKRPMRIVFTSNRTAEAMEGYVLPPIPR